MVKSLVYKIRSSINAKFIFVFTVCLILPLVVLSGFIYTATKKILMQREAQSVYYQVSIIGENIDNMFVLMGDIIASLAVNNDVEKYLKSESEMISYEWFVEFKGLGNLLQSLSLKTSNNYSTAVVGKRETYAFGKNLSSTLNMDSALSKKITEADGNLIILNTGIEFGDSERTIVFGKSIKRYGETIGLVAIAMPTSNIDVLLRNIKKDNNKVFITDRNGKLIYTLDENVSNRQELAFKDSSEYVSTVYPLNYAGTTITTLIPTNEIYKESKSLFMKVGIAFFVILLETVVAMAYVSGKLSKNIKRLNVSISEFGVKEPLADSMTIDNVKIDSLDEVWQLKNGFLKMSERIKDLLLQIKENEKNKRLLEFKVLQAQINPHMIYNTLNTITYLAQIQNIKNIEEVSLAFANLLHTISNNTDEFITIEEEVGLITSFISLKEYNTLCEIKTILRVAPAVKRLNILKLILQPLVENCIIHGFKNKYLGIIKITIYRLEGNVIAIIEDNGVGMDYEKVKAEGSSHIGIQNVVKRLEIHYGQTAKFEIESKKDEFTKITIRYPE